MSTFEGAGIMDEDIRRHQREKFEAARRKIEATAREAAANPKYIEPPEKGKAELPPTTVAASIQASKKKNADEKKPLTPFVSVPESITVLPEPPIEVSSVEQQHEKDWIKRYMEKTGSDRVTARRIYRGAQSGYSGKKGE